MKNFFVFVKLLELFPGNFGNLDYGFSNFGWIEWLSLTFTILAYQLLSHYTKVSLKIQKSFYENIAKGLSKYKIWTLSSTLYFGYACRRF